MEDLLPRLMTFVREQPWALTPEKHVTLVDILRFRNAGGRLNREEIAARIGPRAERPRDQFLDLATDQLYAERFDGEGQSLGFLAASGAPLKPGQAGVIAVISVLGIIAQRASEVDDISGPGATSIEKLTNRFRSARDDASVRATVFDFDSPGGGVYGVQELADEIRAARGTKPMVSVANSLAASAAYWLASAADEVSVVPSGEVGSIGVYGAHEDLSGMLEKEGVKVTLISAGKFKVEGNPFEPLSEDARAYWQARVDEYYDAFAGGVAKSRGMPRSKVEKDFGQGRVVGAKAALEAGMVDRIETLDHPGLKRRLHHREPAARARRSSCPRP